MDDQKKKHIRVEKFLGLYINVKHNIIAKRSQFNSIIYS